MTVAILEKVRHADNLPTLPAVAIKILDSIQAEDVSAHQIAEIIEQDPALTVKLLKVANSSLFGMCRSVSSVHRAVVVLGLRTVRILVLGFSLVDAMSQTRRTGFAYRPYWQRSLTTAVAARLLANRIAPDSSDQAFVSGLLCDIGMLAAFHSAEDLYGEVLAQHAAGTEPLHLVEKAVLGVTHETIGSMLLDDWRLPKEISEPTATHHHPIDEHIASQDPTIQHVTRVLRAATTIADLFCTNTTPDRLAEVTRLVVRTLPINEDHLNNVLGALGRHVRETASLLSMNIGPIRSYQDIQACAAAELAHLTMTAELERAQLAQREKATRREMRQLHEQNRELAQQASVDSLTGVANRATFEKQLGDVCRHARRKNENVGMILLDVDRFKKINDTFGHLAGEEALKEIGALLKNIEDEHTWAARYGGEEFAVIMTNVVAEEIRDLAEEIRHSIQQIRIHHGQQGIRFTVSAGAILMAPDDPNLQPHQLVQLADQCLYAAKRQGRDRVVFHRNLPPADKLSPTCPSESIPKR